MDITIVENAMMHVKRVQKAFRQQLQSIGDSSVQRISKDIDDIENRIHIGVMTSIGWKGAIWK